MENSLSAIGDCVQKRCVVCGEERSHIVASINKGGQIVSVQCPQCGTRSRFKKGEGLNVIARAREGAPYNWASTYRKGQTMLHPTFGLGEVTAVVDPGKIDVLFSDRIRRLVHTKV
ncbi:MAG: hypothetical protein JST84_06185 [Acidobacteria bacterium]|nr:hypothetical protein [Acidobacteriota bacterium]